MTDMRAPSAGTAATARRWEAADSLLPAPSPLPAGCGTEFAVTGPDGGPQAAAACEHWEGEAGSLELTWGAARRFELTIQASGPDVPACLDAVLDLWREHLAGLAGAADADSAAIVTWPSRDVDGAAPLLRHGFAPLAVIAARAPARPAAEAPAAPARPAVPAGVPAGVRIRRAGPADLEPVVRLGLEVVRFDAHFGGVTERPWTADALRREIAGMLAAARPWVWLAERDDGRPVGMLAAEQPAEAGWIAARAGPGPVSYLLLMGVQPGDRARGLGAALAAQLNAETDASLVPVTLLHYAQVNPLSAPFWSQQGYRPLWTCWEARPAAAVR